MKLYFFHGYKDPNFDRKFSKMFKNRERICTLNFRQQLKIIAFYSPLWFSVFMLAFSFFPSSLLLLLLRGYLCFSLKLAVKLSPPQYLRFFFHRINAHSFPIGTLVLRKMELSKKQSRFREKFVSSAIFLCVSFMFIWISQVYSQHERSHCIISFTLCFLLFFRLHTLIIKHLQWFDQKSWKMFHYSLVQLLCLPSNNVSEC